jgi:hypothetical protein
MYNTLPLHTSADLFSLYQVENIIVHPQYDERTIDFDFTLIKLAEPVQLNDHVAPACFPSEEDDLVTSFPPGKVGNYNS